MTSSLQHPNLGTLVGKDDGDIVQYLGVQYATVENRLAPSKVLSKNGNRGTIDARKIGPATVCLPNAIDMEFGFIQQSLPKPEFPPPSEVEGLNLSLSVPKGAKNLPVFVFIHGGGFFIGSSNWPQNDMGKFVQLSVKRGTPIIGIGINYRLGAFGFLTSEELRKEGYIANNGLRDQRTALQWIKENIAGFGGDPDNVTLAGESAGGVSTILCLHSETPLFKRAISMSGTPLLNKPKGADFHEANYAALLKNLGVDGASTAERVKALLETPTDKFLEAAPPSLSWSPFVDGDTVKCAAGFDDIEALSSKDDPHWPGMKWCKELLVGDCMLDSSIFSYPHLSTPSIASSFTTSIKRALPGPAASALLTAYSIPPTSEDPATNRAALLSILDLGHDVGFLAPALAFARGFPGRAWVYHFNATNPFPAGPWVGFGTHVLDVSFVFQNFTEFLRDEKQREAAEGFGGVFIDFVRGQGAGWGVYKKGSEEIRGGPVGVIPDEGKVVEAKDSVAAGRREVVWKVAKEAGGLDKLSEAFFGWMMGK